MEASGRTGLAQGEPRLSVCLQAPCPGGDVTLPLAFRKQMGHGKLASGWGHPRRCPNTSCGGCALLSPARVPRSAPTGQSCPVPTPSPWFSPSSTSRLHYGLSDAHEKAELRDVSRPDPALLGKLRKQNALGATLLPLILSQEGFRVSGPRVTSLKVGGFRERAGAYSPTSS